MTRLKKILLCCLFFTLVLSVPISAATSPDDVDIPTTHEKTEDKEEDVKKPETVTEGDCVESEDQLICEIDDKNYFYTIVGTNTPVYTAIVQFDGNLIALSNEELISLLKLKVYDHKTSTLLAYEGDVLIEKLSDDKYTAEVLLMNGSRLKLPITVSKEDGSYNEPVVLGNISNLYINNKKFFYLGLANGLLLIFAFKFVLDLSFE